MSRQTSRKVIIKESTGRRIIEQSRIRLWCIALFFLLCFGSIVVRMFEVAVFNRSHGTVVTVADPDDEGNTQEVDLASTQPTLQRGDIVDRNGELLATSLMTESVFVNPKEMLNKEEAAGKLAGALGLDGKRLLTSFQGGRSFIWIKHNLSPKEQQRVNSLGIPGLYFLPEEKRVYPFGNIAAHAVGTVGLDNKGQSGLEKEYDERLRDGALNRQPLALSVDVRLQAIMHDEVAKAMDEFQAEGAAGVIMDVHTGEILSMVSLPDFDPNKPGRGDDPARFDRASQGTYEMGSTFKSFTLAMAMQYGAASMRSSYDATNPLRVAGFTIKDDHPQSRWLTLPEVYAYSSNIGAARIALDVGTPRQRGFLDQLGMLKPVDIDLPERAMPQYPSEWKEINTVTIAYGHGIAVTPLHLVRGIAAMVDGGFLPHLTLLKDGSKGKPVGERVISEQTSEYLRCLMRIVVEHGTGGNADVPGYRVGGKTGTAEKAHAGGYEAHANLASFIAAFPIDHPQYVVLVMVDDPKGDKQTHGFVTGGWISAPVVGRVIGRMGPLLGMRPKYDVPEDDVKKYWVENSKEEEKHAAHAQPATLLAIDRRYLHEASY